MSESSVQMRHSKYRVAIVGAVTAVAVLAGACSTPGSQARHPSPAHSGGSVNVAPVSTIVTTPPFTTTVTSPAVTAPPVTTPVTTPVAPSTPVDSGSSGDTSSADTNLGAGTLAPNFFDGPPGCNPPAC